MDVRITPHRLEGTVTVPASKSMAHRAIICAALSHGTSKISGVTFSKDIHATLSVMRAFGAAYEIQGDTITICGISDIPETAEADCCESGSTLRFLIPVAAALGIRTTFLGQGRLPERPITPYLRELPQKGITFDYRNTMPFSVSGRLQHGTFALEGDISSQFITGLLFALPLLDGDSDIVLTSPLQSKPYADMTIGCMAQFGVRVQETESGYHIFGSQHYQAHDLTVEGDFSQAAFFYVANAVGNAVTLKNIPEKSLQGDRKIVEILDRMWYNSKEEFLIDASDIPDLVPIIAVAASLCPRKVRIFGAERLRIKESDRLETTAALLNSIGGNVQITSDGLDITPVSTFTGGVADSAGDHRIAMCAAIAATRASGDILICGAHCVEKSYPAFFEDYQSLGGIANGIHLE
ncbi:MAG: 3-phosphoshikimate 1-carboxyvinyltransferase [Oscillospiraceae bacterium]|nr:3-phosphoshikimate 1-carboxyvinyltransferase [Oscillospiraceae bacterium]